MTFTHKVVVSSGDVLKLVHRHVTARAEASGQPEPPLLGGDMRLEVLGSGDAVIEWEEEA